MPAVWYLLDTFQDRYSPPTDDYVNRSETLKGNMLVLSPDLPTIEFAEFHFVNPGLLSLHIERWWVFWPMAYQIDVNVMVNQECSLPGATHLSLGSRTFRWTEEDNWEA